MAQGKVAFADCCCARLLLNFLYHYYIVILSACAPHHLDPLSLLPCLAVPSPNNRELIVLQWITIGGLLHLQIATGPEPRRRSVSAQLNSGPSTHRSLRKRLRRSAHLLSIVLCPSPVSLRGQLKLAKKTGE